MEADNQIPVLTFVNGDRAGEFVSMGPTFSLIAGRSPEVDVVLRDDSVSRKHARLYLLRGDMWLRDLGSRNGTLINGEPAIRQRLCAGDRIAIGATLLRVDYVDESQMQAKEESTGRAMSGSLEDIPLADVLQWLATSRKSGVLTVRGPRTGLLFLESGRVRSAKLEGLQVYSPEKALLRMMFWNHGMFELNNTALADDSEPEISTSLEHLLMESARQQDELAHLADGHPLPKERISLRFPPKTSWSELDSDHLEFVQSIVQAQLIGHSWDDLLGSHEVDDVSLTKRALRLHELGVVKFDDEN